MRVALVSCDDLPDWEVDDRPLMAALAARGVEVAQVPWTADVDWSTWDGALIRTPWDYWFAVDAFLAWVDATAQVTRLWHGPEVVRWNLRKTYLRELEAEGVPLAPTAWVQPGDDVGAEVTARGWTRGFLKPVVGASASDTLRFDATADGLAAATRHLADVGQPMLLQPYLEVVETDGEHSVIVIDGVPTHAVRKVPVPGDYRVQDDHGATDHAVPMDPGLAALAEATLAAAGRVLGRDEPFVYARVDAIRFGEGWVLNELEVVEPSLFFRHGVAAAGALAEAVVRRLGNVSPPMGVHPPVG